MPDWAAGKTADEIVKLADTFYKAALTPPPALNAAPPPPQTPAPRAPMTEQNQQPQPPDPQLQYTNPALYQQELLNFTMAMARAEMQGFAAPVLAQQATLAKDAAKRSGKRAEVWQKYEAEIDAQMANVPLQARTVDAWDMAAKIVAAEHMEEIVAERASALAARPDTGTLAGGTEAGGAAVPASDPISALFAADDPSIQKFKAQGMDARRVLAHAAAQGHSPERYADMLRKGSVVRSVVYETRNGETTAVTPATVS